MLLIQFSIVMGFVLVQLFAGNLRFLEIIPRSRWLSVSGGISVAYVFIHLFPEMENAQKRLEETGRAIPWFEHHAWVVALTVLFAFLAGGVVLNVLKEELPEERRSRFLPFAGGAACYAALLLLL